MYYTGYRYTQSKHCLSQRPDYKGVLALTHPKAAEGRDNQAVHNLIALLDPEFHQHHVNGGFLDGSLWLHYNSFFKRAQLSMDAYSHHMQDTLENVLNSTYMAPAAIALALYEDSSLYGAPIYGGAPEIIFDLLRSPDALEALELCTAAYVKLGGEL